MELLFLDWEKMVQKEQVVEGVGWKVHLGAW